MSARGNLYPYMSYHAMCLLPMCHPTFQLSSCHSLKDIGVIQLQSSLDIEGHCQNSTCLPNDSPGPGYIRAQKNVGMIESNAASDVSNSASVEHTW